MLAYSVHSPFQINTPFTQAPGLLFAIRKKYSGAERNESKRKIHKEDLHSIHLDLCCLLSLFIWESRREDPYPALLFLPTMPTLRAREKKKLWKQEMNSLLNSTVHSFNYLLCFQPSLGDMERFPYVLLHPAPLTKGNTRPHLTCVPCNSLRRRKYPASTCFK